MFARPEVSLPTPISPTLAPRGGPAMGAGVTQRLNPDAFVILALTTRCVGEASRRSGRDLDPRLALHDLDTSHFLARHMAATAQER